MKTFQKDKLTVEIYENRTLMGEAAAKDIKAKIAELLAEKQEINMIFAAAPSQNGSHPRIPSQAVESVICQTKCNTF
jgi:glucosamine-6-phosphate deaminase